MKTREMNLKLLLAVFALAVADPAAALEGQADIVDADTIKIGGAVVRLQGIDAPESRQTCQRAGLTYACGVAATKALVNIIASRPVQCRLVGYDAYHRSLGFCSVGDVDINGRMVTEGWALAFVKYSTQYLPEQRVAETGKIGLWAGTFDSWWIGVLPKPRWRSRQQWLRHQRQHQRQGRAYLSHALPPGLQAHQDRSAQRRALVLH